MNRPLLMRVLSGRRRRSAFNRLYLPAADRWRPLFTNALLKRFGYRIQPITGLNEDVVNWFATLSRS